MIPYFTDYINNQPVYRCLRCKFDSFEESTTNSHCLLMHGTIKLPEADLDLHTWVNNKSSFNPLQGKKVALCLLTWNTDTASACAASSLSAEQYRLGVLGIHAPVIWFDNGSTDTTKTAVKDNLRGYVYRSINYTKNIGQSRARNVMINEALECGADYIFMLDGDIEVIPYSVFALAQFIQRYGRLYTYSDTLVPGCIGLLSNNCTPTWDEQTARTCRNIDLSIIGKVPGIAWTQYGVFSRQVFEKGVRFDENGPFDGPGWGFEDLDLYLSMQKAGFECLNTPYFRYLHRHRHSSIPLLGTLAAKVFDDRKAYVLDKWSKDPELGPIARTYSTYRMPVLA